MLNRLAVRRSVNWMAAMTEGSPEGRSGEFHCRRQVWSCSGSNDLSATGRRGGCGPGTLSGTKAV
jgi:hypothetical protein